MSVRARLPLILTALLALVLSSARWSDTASGAGAARKEPAYQIAAIRVEQSADEFQLRIQGNAPPTYTMYELFEPLRVIIDVADATLSATPALPTNVPQGPILQVNAKVLHEQQPAITRVEIVLAEDRGYSVERRNNDILIAFAKESKSEKTALPKSKKGTPAKGADGGTSSTVQVETGGPVATLLQDLVVDSSDPVVTRVFLRANGPIARYQKAEIRKTASRPDRMYIDIPGVKLRASSPQQQVGSVLKGLRAAQRNGTARVVFDSGLPELFAYEIQPQPDGLLVAIAAPADAASLIAAAQAAPAAPQETTPTQPADEKGLAALLAAAENSEELIKPVIPPLKKAKVAAPPAPPAAVAKEKTKKTAKPSPATPAATDTYSFAGYQKQRISVDFYKIDLHNVFRLFGEISGQNIVVDEAVTGTLTLALNEVPWDFALDIILNLKDLQKEERFSTIVIAPKAKQLAWPKAATQNIAISGGEKLEPISITQRIETPKGVVEAKAIIREASALDKKGDHAGAMARYEKALALWPDNGQLASRMATLCLVHLGLNAKAVHYAKTALAAEPSNLNAALQAAIAQANMKKVPEAKEYFDKAINSDQAAAEALLSYAAFAEEYNSYNGALALLARHAELHGETLESLVATARLLDKKGDRQAAAEQYRTVLLSGYELPADLQQYIKARVAAAVNM